MDAEDRLDEAKRQFLTAIDQDTYCGNGPPDGFQQGAEAGWDAAVAFFKREAFRRLWDSL